MCQVSSSVSQTSSWSGLGVETHSGRSSTIESDSFGNHRIIASRGDDLIRAREESFAGMRWLVVDVNDDRYRIPLSGPRAARSVAIDAGFGNDAVVVDPSVNFPLFIQGGAGDDYLKSGSGPAALLGGSGNDILIGGGSSNDLLLGGAGNDVLHTGGGQDMVSMDDLYRKVMNGRDGWCEKPVTPVTPEAPKMPEPILVAPQPVPVPPRPLPQQPPKLPVRPSLPRPPAFLRPRLSDLMAAVETHNEKGFKSGRSMTKDMLASLYESPAKFRQTLGSMAGKGERDDAVASFLRALFDAGPGGTKLFRDIPMEDKKTMANYLGGGNSWNAQKKGLMLTLSKVTGAWDRNFSNDSQAQDYLRRYAGVF